MKHIISFYLYVLDRTLKISRKKSKSKLLHSILFFFIVSYYKLLRPWWYDVVVIMMILMFKNFQFSTNQPKSKWQVLLMQEGIFYVENYQPKMCGKQIFPNSLYAFLYIYIRNISDQAGSMFLIFYSI